MIPAWNSTCLRHYLCYLLPRAPTCPAGSTNYMHRPSRNQNRFRVHTALADGSCLPGGNNTLHRRGPCTRLWTCLKTHRTFRRGKTFVLRSRSNALGRRRTRTSCDRCWTQDFQTCTRRRRQVLAGLTQTRNNNAEARPRNWSGRHTAGIHRATPRPHSSIPPDTARSTVPWIVTPRRSARARKAAGCSHRCRLLRGC